MVFRTIPVNNILCKVMVLGHVDTRIRSPPVCLLVLNVPRYRYHSRHLL